jgi:hypothetical protein
MEAHPVDEIRLKAWTGWTESHATEPLDGPHEVWVPVEKSMGVRIPPLALLHR